MKIFEYRPFLGGLSLGLEQFSQNEVVEVAKIPQIASFSYNNTHKQWFLPDFSSINSYETEKDYDLAILNPDLGSNFARRGKSNFKINDLEACYSFLRREMPEFAIITADINAIPLLNDAPEYVRDGLDQLSRDNVVYNLQKMGYKAHLIAIDEADYGIPVHKHIAMYIATPNDFNLKFPKGLFNRYGRGKYNKYRTIADAIGDLGATEEWSAYSSEPQNVYQRRIRRDMPKVTWHFNKRKVTEKQKAIIQKIRPGLNARKTENLKQNSGYNRPKWDRICSGLDDRFYTTSSKLPSIHPVLNRPFTIREGMRIMGLPDNISFDLRSPPKEIANMVVNTISPTIGVGVALALKAIE